tara:strand:+ start:654 stop:1181 length:528 start_codon:yes stop_codon:yes gene_type:complete
MEKKTINKKNPTFIQSINITKEWCEEWESDLLSDEILADRIAELIRTKNGARGFFAYTLSDNNCTLLDKLPTSLIFKFREQGESIVEITLKNLIMSSAQTFNHEKNVNLNYAEMSKNISERCICLLRELDTALVTKKVNESINDLDNMGNSFDKTIKYNASQKEFILKNIRNIAN